MFRPGPLVEAIRGRGRSVQDGRGWLLSVPLALLVLCLAAPLVAIAMTAFEHGVGRFGSALGESIYLRAIERTAVLALIVTAICLGLGIFYAIGLAVSPAWVRFLLFASLFATFWISLLVRTYGWILLLEPVGALYWSLHKFGLRDAPLTIFQTTPAMYPAMVAAMLPFMVLPIYRALIGIDRNHIWAARSLGGRAFLVLWRIVLPELRGGIVAGSTLVFMISLGFFVTPRFLAGPSDFTLSTVIDHEFERTYDFPTASAMGIGLLAGVLVLFLVAERVFNVTESWERG
jgi:putative spermidine/putrescine transport system permease protein